MARSECPIVVVNSSTGLPVSGASVAIKFRSSGLNATWWTQETGGTGSTAAVTTDVNGRVAAWCDRGAYNCTVSGSGITTYTEPWDSTPAADSSIDSLWLPDNVIQQRHLGDSVVGTAEIIDGAITSAKILDGTIAAADLATGAKQLFPQLDDSLVGAKTISFGAYDDGSSWGVTPEHDYVITHGLPATPTVALATAKAGTSTVKSNDPVVASVTAIASTTFTVRARFVSGGNGNFPGVTIYWLAIAYA